MSALAGLCRLDGAPVEPAALTLMLASMAHRRPDARTTSVDGSAALGSLSSFPHRETARPVSMAGGRLRIAFDGRIDNRAELAAALGLGGPPPDAELVVRAVEHWSHDAFRRLLGDFAVAIWDAGARRLLLARDVLGIRPLFYRAIAGTIAFATEPCALVEPPFERPGLNEGMIGEHLASMITSTSDTVFEGVHRVPPAHLIEADTAGIRCRRYWHVDPGLRTECAGPEEYDERFRTLLRDAVACRMREGVPVGIMLSGGLDSGAITATAARLAAEGLVRPPTTLSIVFPGEPYDEGRWIDAMVERWPLPHRRFTPGAAVPGASGAESRRTRELPENPNGAISIGLKHAARDMGIGVLLTGIGGDEWFTGSYARYADLLRVGRVGACLASMRADGRNPDFAGYGHATRQALWPFVPGPIKTGLRWLVRGDGVPRWIDRAFARRVALADRLRAQPGDVPPFPTLAQREMVQEAMSGATIHAFEMHDRSTAACGLENGHPFHDRRLLEFGLGLPEHHRWAGGRSKAVVRRAMRDELPPLVRDRLIHFDFSHLVADAIEAEGGPRLLSALTVARCGWVDASVVMAAYERLRARRAVRDWQFNRDVSLVWGVMSVELWLRALDESSPCVEPKPEHEALCR